MTLKELRIKAGLTQQELADAAGIPPQTLRMYESGRCRVENMTLGRALRVASALGVPPSTLLEADKEK